MVEKNSSAKDRLRALRAIRALPIAARNASPKGMGAPHTGLTAIRRPQPATHPGPFATEREARIKAEELLRQLARLPPGGGRAVEHDATCEIPVPSGN
jgi:hypothetical protein